MGSVIVRKRVLWNAYTWRKMRSAWVEEMDPEADRLLMENLARHIGGYHRDQLLRMLEVVEPPASGAVPDEERYRIFREQVQRIDCPEFLEEVASGGRDEAGCFAFCRLTGYVFKGEGLRSFACGQIKNAAPGGIRAFCGRMVKENGPFAKEAAEWLERAGNGPRPENEVQDGKD